MGSVGFGDIRAIMSREPELAWRQLKLAAARYGDLREWREVVVPYLIGHTGGWPRGEPELRVERDWVTDFTEHGRVHPLWSVCTTLELRGDEESPRLFEELSEHGLLDMRRLVMVGDMKERAWRRLGAREDVSFEELRLQRAGQVSLGLTQLARGPWFGGLLRLEVSGGRMGLRGVEVLARTEMHALRSLALDSCAIGRGALRALAEPKWASSLTALELTDRGGAIARSRAAQSMRELHVSDDELTEVFSERFEDVESLALDGVNLSGRAEALARALGPRLEVLSCAGCQLSDSDVIGMVRQGVFERARHIDLRHNRLSERGFEALSHQQMPRLERLRVWPTASWGREEAEAYAQSDVWGDEVRRGMWGDLEPLPDERD